MLLTSTLFFTSKQLRRSKFRRERNRQQLYQFLCITLLYPTETLIALPYLQLRIVQTQNLQRGRSRIFLSSQQGNYQFSLFDPIETQVKKNKNDYWRTKW